MYAAAGGASLASRQARQKQRKQSKNVQHVKSHKATDFASRAQPHSRQFHNYTDPSTIRTSSSRVERNVLKPPTLQPERRHSTSQLKEPSRARIRESPSVLIPVQNHLNQQSSQQQQQQHQLQQHQQQSQPLSPNTLVREHAPFQSSHSIQSQLPQIPIPEGEGALERRCSFVRQVEGYDKGDDEILDRFNNLTNYEAKEFNTSWENDLIYYSEFHKGAFGSTEYPFSECSQGRAAWQERQAAAAAGAGRRCSLSYEAQQQNRQKQAEAHHRWIKRNRIHDTTYGGESDEDLFSIYHQSAAANALLYVGLGTTAIGFVVFFVGSGDKGFKTLELRLIGPTLIACGLLCCLVRVLLCACPSTCLQRRKKKKRLKNSCTNRSRYSSERQEKSNSDFFPVDPTQSLISKEKKRVSIAPQKSLPSTSTSEHLHSAAFQHFYDGQSENSKKTTTNVQSSTTTIPVIAIPDFANFNDRNFNLNRSRDSRKFRQMSREDTCIELENLEFTYDLQSVSSYDDDDDDDGDVVVDERDRYRDRNRSRDRDGAVTSCSVVQTEKMSRHNFGEKSTDLLLLSNAPGPSASIPDENEETSLTVVIESNDQRDNKKSHSGIVLSPLQLGQ